MSDRQWNNVVKRVLFCLVIPKSTVYEIVKENIGHGQMVMVNSPRYYVETDHFFNEQLGSSSPCQNK